MSTRNGQAPISGTDAIDAAIEAAAAPPTRIAARDLGYFKRVKAQAEDAQDRLQQAVSHEQQARQLRAEATALMGAFESYAQYLCEQYGLDPTDAIGDDGTIVRAQAQPEGAPAA